MTPVDLLERAKAEGVTAELKVRLEWDAEPSPELRDLLKAHRDDLITYLAMPYGDTPEMCRLSEQLKDGATWCSGCYRYQMNPCKPDPKKFYRGAG